jgi:hypothetical protein
MTIALAAGALSITIGGALYFNYVNDKLAQSNKPSQIYSWADTVPQPTMFTPEPKAKPKPKPKATSTPTRKPQKPAENPACSRIIEDIASATRNRDSFRPNDPFPNSGEPKDYEGTWSYSQYKIHDSQLDEYYREAELFGC